MSFDLYMSLWDAVIWEYREPSHRGVCAQHVVFNFDNAIFTSLWLSFLIKTSLSDIRIEAHMNCTDNCNQSDVINELLKPLPRLLKHSGNRPIRSHLHCSNLLSCLFSMPESDSAKEKSSASMSPTYKLRLYSSITRKGCCLLASFEHIRHCGTVLYIVHARPDLTTQTFHKIRPMGSLW